MDSYRVQRDGPLEDHEPYCEFCGEPASHTSSAGIDLCADCSRATKPFVLVHIANDGAYRLSPEHNHEVTVACDCAGDLHCLHCEGSGSLKAWLSKFEVLIPADYANLINFHFGQPFRDGEVDGRLLVRLIQENQGRVAMLLLESGVPTQAQLLISLAIKDLLLIAKQAERREEKVVYDVLVGR